MVKHFSAGVIVLDTTSLPKILLIQHRDGNKGSHWGVPKGWVEQGETSQEAALRELSEEAGITSVTLFPNLEYCDRYTFTQNGERVQKEVVYFVGKTSDRTITIQESEIFSYGWFTFKEAIEKVVFPNMQTVLLSVERDITSLI